MPPDQWDRIQDLFHRSVDLPPSERAAFLEQACGTDENLRRNVEELLASDDAETGLLQAAVDEAVEQLPPATQEGFEMVGARVGQYLITGLVGRGGMGVVYRAERDNDFRMQVAIKLINSRATETTLRRFHIERQILAGLRHPNIAHLIDGGATSAGLP